MSEIYSTGELVDLLRHFWDLATGTSYGHEHEVMRAAADDLERKDAELAKLRKALITAAQWMPTPGTEYTEDAKADVRQVQEALGWLPIEQLATETIDAKV